MEIISDLESILSDLGSLRGVSRDPRSQREILDRCFDRLLLIQDMYAEIFRDLALQVGRDMKVHGNEYAAGELAAEYLRSIRAQFRPVQKKLKSLRLNRPVVTGKEAQDFLLTLLKYFPDGAPYSEFDLGGFSIKGMKFAWSYQLPEPVHLEEYLLYPAQFLTYLWNVRSWLSVKWSMVCEAYAVLLSVKDLTEPSVSFVAEPAPAPDG